MDDAIWDNTNPYNVSPDDMNGTGAFANIHETKESITPTTTMGITGQGLCLYLSKRVEKER